MGTNTTARNFKARMQELAQQMKGSFHDMLLAQGDELVDNIQRAIPHNVTGHLKQSVRKKDVSTDTKLTVLVLAGGPLTTKRTPAGHSFDYALAEEFGTEKQDPRPFFYSSVRLYRAGGLEQFRETFEETIAENNRTRAILKDNYSNAGVSVNVGHRGAISAPKGLK
ncbi:HK97 gp10 family phage protein [Bradyrhizobium japonicum]|uniref:HK97-gp10 family putative phage morphogenesis protein n=2 Tax=Bradyrhizobium elkanii TaxID=29448 RepID=UPI00036C0DB4|nr:HK97-gp10 family putative phage morphogenesis protein [Bradyrhizobium elkanii]WAX24354.1 hypothetical protein [Bradyrhizobium phage ppBeUSDA76-1]MCP1731269.1 HK97 gp10 family phage protein [Bradyrhizobium elkanii]MCS3575398.1 HK97 gp10 family phage protein [Bradyrhizobium elkanii]MCS3591911.1 HK97 gp10 family phage protein [Bradyrhizobium elkanii]MCS3621356.1 HK97 gp10 family phage protein [Bradyrhizobium elkanii]